MISGVLQDWTTQRGDAGTNGLVVSIPQSEHCYLDVSEFDDVVLFLDVREINTSVAIQMAYETAVSRDDASFVALLPAFTLAVNTSPRVDRVFGAYAGIPVARYLRWHLTTTQATAIWDVCFRLTYAAYAPGI